ncbi:MAG: c-type cytochrome [Ignavibacteriae bacterium]|nr:c-type cytochrome [Ignavibacteriota bacterium]
MKIRRVIIASFVLIISILWAQQIELPKNPLQGQIVFEEKQCIECHAIGGYGGTEGPDLSQELYFGSVLELASIIWNHTPQMNRKFRQLRMDRPQFTQEEMLDLFGFLYYLRYLGEPGSVAKGKKLLEAKGCKVCHAVAGKGGTVGPDFEQLQQYDSPLYLVQAMWNHGETMQEELKKSGMTFPTLTGQDISDIAAYIRQATTGNVVIRMAPGDPTEGKTIFRDKQCENCHLVEGKVKKVGPNLSRIELKKGVTEVASLMWNHGPKMLESMKKESIEWPHFKTNEMADLIAYLYFLGFEDKPGDEADGERTFTAKGCTDCHKKGGGGRGPDLASIKRFDSPIRMIQLMWNHASEMEDLLITQNKELPQLSTKEMRDLYAYLRKMTQK